MKRNITIIAILIAAVLAWGVILFPAHAGLNSFRAGVASLLNSEFTAGESARIGNSFVLAYPAEFNALVANSSIANTAAGRRQFAAYKIADYTRDVVRGTESSTAVNALPTPTPIP